MLLQPASERDDPNAVLESVLSQLREVTERLETIEHRLGSADRVDLTEPVPPMPSLPRPIGKVERIAAGDDEHRLSGWQRRR